MPATPADRALHARMLGGDPLATAEVAEQFLGPVLSNLKRRFPNLHDDQWRDEAAVDSIVAYFRQPGRYQPDKLGLAAYLTMSAAGDLKNKLAAERRRTAKLRETAVELLPENRNTFREQPQNENLPPLADWLEGLFDDPADREAASLVLNGVRATERFAAVYGLTKLPIGEQRKRVKRHKDRLKKVLQRHGAESL